MPTKRPLPPRKTAAPATPPVAREVREEPVPMAEQTATPKYDADNYLLNGYVVPVNLDPKKDIDPIILTALDKLYDGDTEAEILAYKQVPKFLPSTPERICVIEAAKFIIHVWNEKPGGEHIIHFMQFMGMPEVYTGKSDQLNMALQSVITLSSEPSERTKEIELITSSFRWALGMGAQAHA